MRPAKLARAGAEGAPDLVVDPAGQWLRAYRRIVAAKPSISLQPHQYSFGQDIAFGGEFAAVRPLISPDR